MLGPPTIYLLRLGLHETYLIRTSVIHASIQGNVYYKNMNFMNDLIRKLQKQIYE